TAASALPACRWCGRPGADWCCPQCGGRRMRAGVIGAARTAEELGRAFPGYPVRSSLGDRILPDLPAGPAVVVATPGAEPVVDGGYGAALLLDGWALLSRPDLRAGEQTLRRWMNAASLVRSEGRVVVGADAGLAPVQALIRWDPWGAAARELAERAEVGFAPAVRMASLSGAPTGIAELVSGADLPAGAELIGPVPVGDDGAQRMLIRVPRERGAELAAALKVSAAGRSARKAGDPIKIVLDPSEL
ncbi:MAG: primosome assembly protein PriA, partial [Actinomycetota bacterium]|nr:primosome assembly protein PriA [Actinomycetota bacterium]